MPAALVRRPVRILGLGQWATPDREPGPDNTIG